MPIYSMRSRSRLFTCDERIVRVFEHVIEHYDHTILCGARTKEAQQEAFDSGHSRVQWPLSRHNVWETAALEVDPPPMLRRQVRGLPLRRRWSRAIDAAPWRPRVPHVDWSDREGFTLFAGFVLGTACRMGINIRWGGDWNMDRDVTNNTFDDLGHFELED